MDIPSVQALIKAGIPGRLPSRGPLQLPTSMTGQHVETLLLDCEMKLASLKNRSSPEGPGRPTPDSDLLHLVNDLHRNLVYLAVLEEINRFSQPNR